MPPKHRPVRATHVLTGERRTGTAPAPPRYRLGGGAILTLSGVVATTTEGCMFKFLRNVLILREIWRLFKRSRRA
jgi:hypothetical protein